MAPNDAKTCRDLLAAGKVPGYGMLADPHHGPCYRAFHGNLFGHLVFGTP